MLLVAALLATGGLLAAPVGTASNHCDATVSDGDSIQAAIDAAAAGETVCVEAGTYAEDVTVDVQDLTLEGPNAGTAGDADRDDEATVEGQLVVSASGATLDGFEVSPPNPTTNAEGEALRISPSPDDVVVRNNVVADFNGSELPDWEGADAIVAFGGDGSDAIENVTITRNKVQNVQGNDVKGGATGVSIQGNVVDATVEDNVVEDVGMEATGWAFGLVVRGTGNHGEVPSAVDLAGNTVTNLSSNPDTDTLAVGIGAEADASEMAVTDNAVTHVELLVENKDTEHTLDVTGNWWGDENGPDTDENPMETSAAGIGGDGDVDYLPWLDAPADEGGELTGPVEVLDGQSFHLGIQDGVDAAASGDTVFVRGATYEETLHVDTENLTVEGVGADAVTVDASSGTTRGITAQASGFTLANVTVRGANDYGVKVEVPGGPPEIGDVELRNLVVEGSDRSELDLHGVDGATIANATLRGQGTSGNGLAVTDSHDITVEELTTRGNTWGGFAIYTSGDFVPAGTSSVTLAADHDIRERNPVYSQVHEGEVTDLTLNGFPAELTFDSAPSFTFYQPDGPTAVDRASDFAADDRFTLSTAIVESEGEWFVGDGFELARTLGDADEGATVNLLGGTYAEQVTVDQDQTLAGTDDPTLEAPASMASGPAGTTAIVTVAGEDTEATLEGVTVAGPGPGACGSIDAGVAVVEGAEATVEDATITAVRDDPLSGCESGVGVQVGPVWHADTTTAGSAEIRSTTISGFQKSAVTVAGDGNEVTISDSTLTCSGADTDETIAQDAVQVWRHASATVRGSTITDCIASFGDRDLGTAIHLSEGAHDVTIADNEIRDSQTAIGLMTYAGFWTPPAAAENVAIRGNTIADNQGGVYLAGPADGVTVANNEITGHSILGVFVGPDDWIEDFAPSPDRELADVGIFDNEIHDNPAPGVWLKDSAEDTDIHLNSFEGNDLAVKNDDIGFVDARYNWWGSPLGPTSDRNPASASGQTGQPNEGYVEHRPFCLEPTCSTMQVVGSVSPV